MKNALRTFALSLIALIGLAASAAAADFAPDRLSLLLGSKHVNAGMEFQEVNPGVFLTWEDRTALDLEFTVGAYQNSYSKASTALVVGQNWSLAEELEVGLFGGLAHYPEDGRTFGVHAGDVVPMGGVQGRYKNMFIQVMPSDGKMADAIVSFGLTIGM
ncbi:hypothetical protein [Tranquillimonas alkanivorans]|uniref:MetA-pathway of phenol degradation n=1 Tax=Tranquillimonas alkanivorans TaxID=441119 RepID=A0A1I5TU24_9RHOB|nr:hypothetical protein [Tranquillimonas alkanivorans]SFP86543.1 hypothetical protein SAMN04488047_11528 [Tranquillimonas alkanivorans]